MKKGVVFAFISIIVILSTIICFFVFNNKDNDKKIVEHLSNQKYAEDVVANGEMKKYDIAPAATPAVVKEVPIEKKELKIDTMKKMELVFTGVAAYMCETNSEYNAYSDKFYVNALKYVSFYNKESMKKNVKLTSDNQVNVSEDALIQISGATFKTRIYGYKEANLNEYGIKYDKKSKNYICNSEVVEGYSIVVDSVNEIVSDDNEIAKGLYEVKTTVYKNAEEVQKITFTVTYNELLEERNDNAFNYSVKDAYIY